MATIDIGQKAENIVKKRLVDTGYEILYQNWKTKTCEIDIVAKKANTIFFIEVKYRSSTSQGDGFEYITPTKVKQMTYAAKLWVNLNAWRGNYELMGASVSGSQHHITFAEIFF